MNSRDLHRNNQIHKMLTRHLTVFLIDYLIIDDESVKIHQVLFWIVSLNACIIFKTFFFEVHAIPSGSV